MPLNASTRATAEAPSTSTYTATRPLSHRLHHDNTTSLDRRSTSSGYELQSRQRKKLKRQNKIVTGNKTTTHGNFSGAPDPQRDIFVYRVKPEAEVEDIRKYMEDYDVQVINLTCMSNVNAKYKSFKLTVGLSDFKRLLLNEEDIWPARVRVRKFITRRETNQYNDQNDQNDVS